MEIIDGRKIAKKIIERLRRQPVPKKIFAAVAVGDDKISENFLKQKKNLAKELGVDFRAYRFPDKITNDELRKEVGKISALKNCNGVIVQLPLPEHINKYYILNTIPKEKDVDVLGERAIGAFYNERNVILPPAVSTLSEILETCNLKLKTLRIAMVGLGFLVGKPISVWLMRKTKDLYLLRKGSDFGILKQADLVITATGLPDSIKPEMLKEGAGVIDFGCVVREIRNEKGEISKKICGDFNSLSLTSNFSSLGFYTPTPGGTGPVLVAKIFENFYKLNQ